MVDSFHPEFLSISFASRTRPFCDVILFIILMYFLETQTCQGQVNLSNDPFYFLSSKTSRVIVRVKGRDARRHMTTYDSIDGVTTSPLNFGFPPTHRRQFSEERLELFDATNSHQQSGIRKITLRHPWNGVFLSWDEHLNVAACSSIAGRRNKACIIPPYWYMETWPTNNSHTRNESCFKLRLLTSNTRNNLDPQVAFIDVSRRDWSLKLRRQRHLLTQALIEVNKLAWEESIKVLFSDHRSSSRRNRSIKWRKRRRKRCSIDATSIRDQLIHQYDDVSVEQEIKQLLKKSNECLLSQQNSSRGIDIITHTSWLEMTAEMKSFLMCHVGIVLRKKLRFAFLSLADTRCVRLHKWGRMVEQERLSLLDRNLNNTWRRRKHIVFQKLVAAVQGWMNDKITTLCIQQVT